MTKSKKLSISKIKKLLLLFKYIAAQKRENKIIVLKHLDNESIDNISESIYNLLYNEKLNSKLSTSQKTKIKRIIKPDINKKSQVLEFYFHRCISIHVIIIKIHNKMK